MNFKILAMSLALTVGSFASAAQVATYPLNSVELSYESPTDTVFVTGALISGKVVKNSVSSVIVNSSELKGKFEVDGKGLVRLALPSSGAFLVGATAKTGAITLDVPYKAFQVSERYDVVEKSFGMTDVDYIVLDVTL